MYNNTRMKVIMFLFCQTYTKEKKTLLIKEKIDYK